jgi:hypothetical protein
MTRKKQSADAVHPEVLSLDARINEALAEVKKLKTDVRRFRRALIRPREDPLRRRDP